MSNARRNAARISLKKLVETQTGVTIESADFIECDAQGNRDRFVFCGDPTALLVVLYYFEHALGVEGCEMAEPDAEDPEWTCLWVPSTGIHAAIKRGGDK